ncbi:response receiver sensor diguanylate cyclase, PAS domain-containing [Syntrophotalea carbinolica DSM 2380]|uniref:Response receiver sensor diguanylate cyclase, PAS domain-containing n=1 Tax=Syntrophotalea carbinolica (strain DSM 2380 / NBRC 103641 / GraBd1) TaxID=338963 RepID=Q3A112_SYNC1|nr:diguanylate cyclase [Syntrophotalea carbinolica]ABA89945.1 response receiver sensor diguanylate cyclase, PAS domain-containing [Syntrophotalea carbinolica DSM 2380]
MKAKLLIVEDEAFIALEIQTRLQRMGYEVCGVVSHGEDAVRQAVDLRPDLVLMDISLKGQMSGVEAAAAIRRTCRIPVVYLTSHADGDTLERAKSTDPYGYLLKPFQEKDLRIGIELALHKHALQRQAEESEEKFRLVTESIDDVFWLSTADLKELIYVSPAYEKIWGRRREELHDAPLSFLEGVHPEDRSAVRSLLDHPPLESLQLEYRIVRPDGSISWVRDRRFPVSDPQGRPYRLAGVVTDITEQKDAQLQLLILNRKLQQQATHDSLTGLPNRRLLIDRLEQALARARRNNGRLAMLFIDLDGFKAVNDRLGHTAGDEVLEIIGRRLSHLLRSADTAARLGGDEFGLVLSKIKDKQDASLVAQKVLEAIASPFIIRDERCYIGASIGISLYPEHGLSADDLISRADTAMYKVKHSGKGTFAFYLE